MIIGSHVSMGGKEMLLGSVKEALSYNANTFMFYTGAPQNTRRKPVSELRVEEAKELMKEKGLDMDNVVVHAPYIINLGNTIKPETRELAVSFLRQEIERCDEIGATRLVLHPGAHVKAGDEAGLDAIVSGLNEAMKPDQKVHIALETMAGKGNEMGKTFEELKAIIDKVKFQDKIGVCIDTCHLNDAGYDMNKFDMVLDDFDKVIGINKIGCIHVNDSKNEIGSHKDRHENIGFGTIGFDNLIKIIYNERLDGIPRILETPYVTKEDNSKDKVYPPYKYEIEMIRNKKFDSNLITKIREG